MVTIDRTNQKLLVNFFSQLPRTLERHHPSGIKLHILASRWIPPPPLPLLMNTEFTEAADQNIFTGCEFGFDDLKQGLDNFDGPLFLKSVFLCDGVDQMVFGESHRSKVPKKWIERRCNSDFAQLTVYTCFLSTTLNRSYD
jgi:hypothetical protein